MSAITARYHTYGREKPLSDEVLQGMQGELERTENALLSGELFGEPIQVVVGFELEHKLLDAGVEEMNDRELAKYFPGQTREQLTAKRFDLEQSRDRIGQEIGALIPDDDIEAEKQKNWLTQIPSLNLAELATYELYRRLSTPVLGETNQQLSKLPAASDAPKDTVEFRFGSAKYGEGWYDNTEFLEIRTRAAPFLTGLQRFARVKAELSIIAQEYGLFFEYGKDDMHISAWHVSDQTPVYDLREADNIEHIREAVGGIMIARTQSLVAVNPAPKANDVHEANATAGPRRDNTVRVLPDRFEFRSSVGEFGSPELNVLAFIAGMAYGHNHPEEATKYASSADMPLFAPADGFDKQTDLHILRALQNSDFKDGRLSLDKDFSLTRGSLIFKALVDRDADIWEPGLVQTLVSTIYIDDNDTLQYDQTAFAEALATNEKTKQYVGNERLKDRLQTVRFAGTAKTVNGSITYESPTKMTLHQDLARFAGSTVLSTLISYDVLERIEADRGTQFTHNEALSDYIYLHVVRDLDLTPVDAAQQLYGEILATIDADPDANKTTVLTLLKKPLEIDIVDYEQMAGEHPAFQSRFTVYTVLHQLLLGYFERGNDRKSPDGKQQLAC